jgi:hypothetical protein
MGVGVGPALANGRHREAYIPWIAPSCCRNTEREANQPPRHSRHATAATGGRGLCSRSAQVAIKKRPTEMETLTEPLWSLSRAIFYRPGLLANVTCDKEALNRMDTVPLGLD